MRLRLIASFVVLASLVVGVGIAVVASDNDAAALSAGERAKLTAPTAGGQRTGVVSAVAVRAARDRLATAQAVVPSQTLEALDLDPASVIRVGSFQLPSGGQHDVYVARSREGWTCIVEQRAVGVAPNGKPLGLYGGGCSPGPLPEYGLKISMSGAGDIDAPGTRGVSIVGIAGSGVDRVVVRLASGRGVAVPLNAAHAFRYSVSPSDIGSPSSPAAVLAFDADGKKVSERPVR